MTFRKIFLSGLLVLLAGCGGNRPANFDGKTPVLVLEDFFRGETVAWGIFEDRFGKLRREFRVDITGDWDGKTLILDERFAYADGERASRVWRIEKTGVRTYEGHADDVIGVAKGAVHGNALNWQYDMDLKIGDSTLRVHFDDWMYLQAPGVLMNRAYVTKFGIEIGSVTLTFLKPGG